MSLSRIVSEISGDFSRKSPIFPMHPRIFNASVEGVSVGIWYGRKESKTRMMGLPDDRKSFKICLAVYIPARDRQTDRQTDTRRQQRRRLCIASRGYSRPAVQSESTAMSPDAILAKYISAVSHDQFDADEQPYAYSCTPRLLYDSHADCMQDSFAFQQRRACGTRFPGGGAL